MKDIIGTEKQSLTLMDYLQKLQTPLLLSASKQNFIIFFGYVKGLSSKLQGSSLDIVEGYMNEYE